MMIEHGARHRFCCIQASPGSEMTGKLLIHLSEVEAGSIATGWTRAFIARSVCEFMYPELHFRAVMAFLKESHHETVDLGNT